MKKCFVLFCFLLFLTACSHTHEWKAATCAEPKTCSICGDTEGGPLGHDWKDATCTEPKTCSRCGKTEGSPAGHDFQLESMADATCESGGYSVYSCSRCGATEYRDKTLALDHDWKAATCLEPKTCARCGKTEGAPAGHNAPDLTCTEPGVCLTCGAELAALGHDWKDATCTEPKTCARCGETEGAALGHAPAAPVIENRTFATCTSPGHYDEVVYCSVCHAELQRETKTEDALGHTAEIGICSRCGNEIYTPVTGTGDDVVSNVNVGDGLYRVHITNNGSRNFIVWIYDKDDDKDLAVNEIGNYDGYCFLSGYGPYTFEVESHGDWSLTIEKLTTTASKSFTGNGDFVTDIFSASTGTWHISNSGSHNFVVWLWTSSGRDLIVNEIGSYDGNKRLSIPAGSSAFLEIESDGAWSIEPVN